MARSEETSELGREGMGVMIFQLNLYFAKRNDVTRGGGRYQGDGVEAGVGWGMAQGKGWFSPTVTSGWAPSLVGLLHSQLARQTSA